jgi:acetyl-CoA acyltransferase
VSDVVIVDALRTPIGKRRGGLADVHAVDLFAVPIAALVERSGVDPELLDDVILGCVTQAGEQAFDVARTALLAAGLPESVPGVTIDRQCGSSQQAIHFAAAGLAAGHYSAVIAGGGEHMTRVPMNAAGTVAGDTYASLGWQARYGVTPSQGISSESVAEKWGLTRTQLDEYALCSHERAAAAQDTGAFDEEIVSVLAVRADEGVRRGSSTEGLAQLKPAFLPDGVVTAGNSSQISDGAAALLMTTAHFAREHGLEPLARVHSVALAAADPVLMLTAPIPATAKVLARSGLSLRDIGAFEVNEAFASVPLAWLAEIGADPDKVNPLGGAIALGHPLGASGARLATTLIHHMRARGIRYGLQAMCEGGGQANATIFELVDA